MSREYSSPAADTIAFGAKVTTFLAVGDEAEVMRLRDDRTRLIDACGRRAIAT
jgi:predicted amidohydrolase YtcJ